MTSTTVPSSSPAEFLRAPRELVENTAYKAQHTALAVAFGVVMRGFHFLMEPGHRRPTLDELLAIDARFRNLLEQDLQNVRDGMYPRELLFDLPVGDYMRVLPHAVVELPRILKRKKVSGFDELPGNIRRENYPDYYLRTFHWQTDGWLSERSARLYDVGVELLFGGAAEVMRRMTLPPLVRELRGMARPRILDVACGTARFFRQAHAALPNAKLYGIDLSHHYVARARENTVQIPDVSLLVERAEKLPFESSSFDAVTSIFLFHELPRDARRDVLKEMLRVVKPGGVVVLNDSVQMSDAPELEYFLGSFHKIYHEPYYKSYLQDDLATAMREVGFSVESEQSLFVTKVVAGRKPHA